MMYKIKRAVVDAVQWNGTNKAEIQNFAGNEEISIENDILFFEDFFVVKGEWVIKTSHGSNIFCCENALFEDLFTKED